MLITMHRMFIEAPPLPSPRTHPYPLFGLGGLGGLCHDFAPLCLTPNLLTDTWISVCLYDSYTTEYQKYKKKGGRTASPTVKKGCRLPKGEKRHTDITDIWLSSWSFRSTMKRGKFPSKKRKNKLKNTLSGCTSHRQGMRVYVNYRCRHGSVGARVV